MKKRILRWLAVLGACTVLLAVVLATQLPKIGAAALLHPFKRPLAVATPSQYRDVTWTGERVELRGWRGDAVGKRRGTLIYLHGVADNRASGEGVIERFRKQGFDVIAYDSRAHGQSGGTACTYGFFEKQDLARVMDTAAPGPIVLFGSSLGAAVSLQLAATDGRVTTVISAESFSDLRTVATDRVPFFFTSGINARAFAMAEQEARFQIEAVSPVKAAAEITIPVLLIHGAQDKDTRPEQAKLLLAALKGPKRLLLVPGTAHNKSLHGDVWGEIDAWLDEALAGKS